MCYSDNEKPFEASMRKSDVLCPPGKTIRVYETSITKCIGACLLGTTIATCTLIFGSVLPYVVTPAAAKAVYVPAFWEYDPLSSHFDNSAWTYVTDYVLLAVMSVLAWSIARSGNKGDGLKKRAAGLIMLYGVSVAAGGVAHQTFLTLESRNSTVFRILWTLCVGTVTAAGGFMGASASQFAKANSAYYIPEWFWVGFGVCTTLACAWGFMSFQRPACDIFIAGITQFPPTMYICMLALTVDNIARKWRVLCVFGFMLNAPLLPMYALILHHSNWSLAQVNTLLHCWLCVAWTLQGLSLRYFSNAMAKKNKVL